MKKTMLQEIVEAANVKFANHSAEWNEEDFFFRISFTEKVAIVLSSLHNEVICGGFAQWINSGNAKIHLPFISRLLVQIDEAEYPQLSEALALAKGFTIVINESILPVSKTDTRIFEKPDSQYKAYKKVFKEMDNYIQSIL